MFETLHWPREGCRECDLSSPRNRAGNFREFPERDAILAAERFHSGFARSGNRSAMRSTRRIFFFRTREFEQMEMQFFCKRGQGRYIFRISGAKRAGIGGALRNAGKQTPFPPARKACALCQSRRRYRVRVPIWLWRDRRHSQPHRFRSHASSGILRQEPASS